MKNAWVEARIDVLRHALSDYTGRPGDEDTLRRIAERVNPGLSESTLGYSADGNSQERKMRLTSLGILSGTPLAREIWEELRPLLYDHDVHISVTAALIGVNLASLVEKQVVAKLLIGAFQQVECSLQMQIEDCLRRNYASVRDVIAEEITRRSGLIHNEVLSNPVLRVLLHLQSEEEPRPAAKERDEAKPEAASEK
jgi:hypothetical protein